MNRVYFIINTITILRNMKFANFQVVLMFSGDLMEPPRSHLPIISEILMFLSEVIPCDQAQ